MAHVDPVHPGHVPEEEHFGSQLKSAARPKNLLSIDCDRLRRSRDGVQVIET